LKEKGKALVVENKEMVQEMIKKNEELENLQTTLSQISADTLRI